MELYLDIFITLSTGIIGAVITFWVNEGLGQGPVRSSALPSLVIGLVFHFYGKNIPEVLHAVPTIYIGASFVGMVSSNVMSGYKRVGMAGFIYGVIYLNSSLFFHGFGGALGMTAAISVLVTLCFPTVVTKRGVVLGIFGLRKLVFYKKYTSRDNLMFLIKHRKKL